jgi:hypothetical protein
VLLQHGEQQCLPVWQVLIEGADGHSGARRHPGGCQPLHAIFEQNLNGGVENCL